MTIDGKEGMEIVHVFKVNLEIDLNTYIMKCNLHISNFLKPPWNTSSR